jgi:hypothetical protein
MSPVIIRIQLPPTACLMASGHPVHPPGAAAVRAWNRDRNRDVRWRAMEAATARATPTTSSGDVLPGSRR